MRSGLRAVLGCAAFGLAAITVFSGCTSESITEAKALAGVNAIRAEYGLPPLEADPALIAVARLRSQDMASQGYFSHSPPDGCNYACLLDQHAIAYSWAGENIAWNTWDWKQTAAMAVEMWRNSPPHMENITTCHFESAGTGVARAANGKIYYTMIFEGDAAC